MSTNYYYNKVGNKTYRLIRTDSRRPFDITDCLNGSIVENNGLLLNAKELSAQYVDDLVASTQLNEDRTIIERKASSKTRHYRTGKQSLPHTPRPELTQTVITHSPTPPERSEKYDW